MNGVAGDNCPGYAYQPACCRSEILNNPLVINHLTKTFQSNSRASRMTCDLNHRHLRHAQAYSLQGQVYTVLVGCKGVWFMLAIVVLWAALPGVACFAPAPHHACCQQMMQDCGSSMALTDPSCCKVHSSDPTQPPAQASRPEGTSQPVHIFVSANLACASLDDALAAHIEAAPGTLPPSRSSILRI